MDFLKAIFPLLEHCKDLDLSKPQEAKTSLEKAFPFEGEFVCNLVAKVKSAIACQEICNRGQLPLKFSRISKAAPDSLHFSVDIVHMSGEGPHHCHPKGEIDLCIALSGDPLFDNNPQGWVVYGEGSSHVPTVENGEMVILYLLPNGAFELVEN